MNYHIIASDLDGTLLNSAGVISPENLAAIHELTEKGSHFVPASGRGYSEMPQQIHDCPDIRYIIHPTVLLFSTERPASAFCAV